MDMTKIYQHRGFDKTTSNSTSVHQNYQQEILVEQLKLVFRSMPGVYAANLVANFSIVVALWKIYPVAQLFAWFTLMLLPIMVQMSLYFLFRRNFKPESARKFSAYLNAGSFVFGLAWGISGIWLFPEGDGIYQMFIVLAIYGMGVGGAVAKSAYPPAFFVYFPLSQLPLIIFLFIQASFFHIALGLLLLSGSIVAPYFVLVVSKNLKETLALRFENIDLIDRLRVQMREAEQANAAKTTFLAAASHDLRQPLYAISLLTSVLDESIKFPKVKNIVTQISASVHALQTLFNSLLDISRLEDGTLKVEKTDFPLQELFTRLANDFNPQAIKKNLDIEWPDCSYHVHTDQSLLSQILGNYISNAIRYTEAGNIRISCHKQENQLKISVTDNGCGIPAEEHQKIFNDFYQLANPERDRSKGLGLGLAIVQRSARLLGHTIELESAPNCGSTFSVTIELADNVDTTSTSSSPPRAVNSFECNAMIVVIDDELSVREGTRQLLEAWGCKVVTAADANEAIEQLNQLQEVPGGIIVDYRLRNSETGIDAIHSICREYDHEFPALIVTGDISANCRMEARNNGYQFHQKPVPPAKLRAFLQNTQRTIRHREVT